MAWQAALKEVADAKKKKRAEKARRKHEREMEITRWVRAGESRGDVEAELESEDPMEVGDDVRSSEDGGGQSVVVTSVERRKPTATSAGGGREAERCGDTPAPRKRAVSLNAVGEREAKRMRSPCPLEASLALPPPALSVVG